MIEPQQPVSVVDRTLAVIAGSRHLTIALAVIFVVVGVVNWTVLGVEMLDAAGDPPADARYGQDLRAFMGAGDIAADRDAASLYDTENPAYTDIDAAEFFNPPWFAVAMATVSWIPFHVLYPLWTVLGLLALLWAIRSSGVGPWQRVTVAAWLAVPTFVGVFFGQLSSLMAAGMGVSIMAAIHMRAWPAGVGFALLAVKPHLLLGFVVAWLADIRRWWRLIAAALVATLLLMALSEVWMPGSWYEFVVRLIENESFGFPEREVSLLGGMQLLMAQVEPLGTMLAVAASLGVLVVVGVSARSPQVDVAGVLGIALIASLLVAPHSLSYDWTLLIVPVAVLAARGIIRSAEALAVGFVMTMAIPVGFAATDLQLRFSDFAFHIPTWTLLGLFIWIVLRVRVPVQRLEVADR